MDVRLPFQASDPVSGELFYNREKVLSDIYTSLAAVKTGPHQNIALISLRRLGKTSLIKVLQERLVKEGVAAVYIDCSNIFPVTLEQFLEEYINQVLKTYAAVAGWGLLPAVIAESIKGVPEAVASIVSVLVSRVGIEIGEIFKLWIELRKDPVKNLKRLFETAIELPEVLGRKTKIPCVVFLDEFQILGKFNSNLLWAFRAKIQLHKHTAYLISGSSVGMLSRIVSDKNSPLYNSFLIRTLEPFTPEDSRGFLRRRSSKFGIKFTEEAIETIVQKSRNIPFYLQWIGLNSYLYALNSKTRVITKELVEAAYQDSLKNIPQLLAEFSKLAAGQQKILVSAAKNNFERPSDIAKDTKVRDVNAIRELAILVDLGYLSKEGRGRYVFTDMVFKEWLKIRFS